MEKFEKAKTMTFPRTVHIGHGVLKEAPALVADLELGSRPIVLSGPHTSQIAGKEVVRHLKAAKLSPEMAIVREATQKQVAAGKKAAQAHKATCVLGVGGGSVIDVGKLVAHGLKLPFVSVPTSPSHDGIASGRASLHEDEGSVSKEASPPIAILADTAVIARAPYRYLASGCADVISNTTAILDWKLAERLKGEEFSSFAASLSQTAAELIIHNADAIKPGLEESVWFVVKALITSGVAMSVAGNSRPASGAEHAFSHMLDRLAPHKALHGEQCGVGTILVMNLHGGDWKQIRDTLRQIGAPTTAKELNVSAKTVVEALVKAHTLRPDRYTILGDKGVSLDAAKKLVKVTGVA